jgi:hypothetical protein
MKQFFNDKLGINCKCSIEKVVLLLSYLSLERNRTIFPTLRIQFTSYFSSAICVNNTVISQTRRVCGLSIPPQDYFNMW